MSSTHIGEGQYHSIAEVEVIVGVAVVFTLSETRADEVERCREPSDSEPNAETEVDDPSLDEEALESAVEPVEEPLLGGVGTVVEDVASGERGLLVVVLFTVPGTPLLLGHAKSLTVSEAHVAGVSFLVMGKSSSYSQVTHQNIFNSNKLLSANLTV